MRSGMLSASMESAVEERTAPSGVRGEGRRKRSAVRIRKERLELVDKDHAWRC